MKMTPWLYSASLLAALPLFGGSLDFSTTPPPQVRLNRGSDRGQTAEIARNPETGKSALLVRWDGPVKHDWFEWSFLSPVTLPEFDQAEFKLNLTTTAPCPLLKINLRLTDANNEIFQYEYHVELDRPGTQTLRYRLDDPQLAIQSWPDGPNATKDGKLDQPVRIQGLSANFTPGAGQGELYLNSLEFQTRRAGESAKVEVVRAEFPVDPAKRPPLELTNAEKRGQQLEFVPNPLTGNPSIRTTWNASENPYFEWSCQTQVTLPDFISADFEIPVTAEAQTPADAISLRLVDATGEVFQFQQPVSFPTAADQCFSVHVDARAPKPRLTWGGNQDQKLDFPVRILGISVDYPQGSSGRLYVDGIRARLVCQTELVDAIRFDVKTENPVHVIEPGKETPPPFELTNTTDQTITVKNQLRLTDYHGRQVVRNDQLTFAPGETRRLPLPELPARGIWYAVNRVENPDNPDDYVENSRSFAYMKLTGATPGIANDGFLFGICSHPNWTLDESIYRQEAIALSQIGAKVLRMDLEWHHMEPREGMTPDYSRYDKIVDLFAARGVELDAILGKAPEWATREPDQQPDAQQWRRHLNDLFTHFKGRIRLWEMWNEPDLLGFARFDVPTYLKLAKIAREEQRKVDPDAIMLSGGFASVTNVQKGDFHERAMRDSGDLFDIHAFHGHGSYPGYVQLIDDQLAPMRERCGVTIPWYANETAITSANSTEKIQAQTLYKKLLYSWSRGSVGYNWYNLRNKGYDPRDGEHNYGMITNDFYPKAVYVAYNTLTGNFTGRTYRRQLLPGDGLWLFEFSAPDGITIGGWNENYSANAGRRILFRTNAADATLVDLMGNETPAMRLGQTVLLPLDREPVTLQLAGATYAEPDQPLVAAEPLPLAQPGDTLPLKLAIHNPDPAQPAIWQLKLNAPQSVTIANPTATVTVPAGETIHWETTITVGPEFRTAFGEPATIVAELALADQDFSDRLQLPINSAVVFHADAVNRDPDFVLNRRDQVVSLYDADPNKAHLLWKTPDDLSAEIRLGASADALLVTVDVTDDVHHQPYRGADVWQGDNVQLSLQSPGREGEWEIGLTLRNDGGSELFAWSTPQGCRLDGGRLQTSRQGNRTRYQAELPLAMLGLTSEDLRNGFRFNLMVNDNDGECREGWIIIAPGMGSGRDPGRYPFVLLQP